MRILSRPSTANCDAQKYVSYLIADPLNTSCSRLSEILPNTSHDSVDRFLLRENFTPFNLYSESSEQIDTQGGVIAIDDSVIDKPYSQPDKCEFIGFYWSGKHHKVVKGINVITLFYTDPNGVRVPVNYRIYNSFDNKTKNDYFLEMLDEVLEWGLLPSYVTGDAWYSSLKNLKHIRKHGLNSLFGIEGNRLISLKKGSYVQAQSLEEYPSDGLEVYLKEYGKVKLFRQTRKNVSRYYIISVANLDDLDEIDSKTFEKIHQQHWNIECFHRAVKQVCHIEDFQVRNTQAVSNHIHCSLLAFIQLEAMTVKNKIANWYQVQKQLFSDVIKTFISVNSGEVCQKHTYTTVVNA